MRKFGTLFKTEKEVVVQNPLAGVPIRKLLKEIEEREKIRRKEKPSLDNVDLSDLSLKLVSGNSAPTSPVVKKKKRKKDSPKVKSSKSGRVTIGRTSERRSSASSITFDGPEGGAPPEDAAKLSARRAQFTSKGRSTSYAPMSARSSLTRNRSFTTGGEEEFLAAAIAARRTDPESFTIKRKDSSVRAELGRADPQQKRRSNDNFRAILRVLPKPLKKHNRDNLRQQVLQHSFEGGGALRRRIQAEEILDLRRTQSCPNLKLAVVPLLSPGRSTPPLSRDDNMVAYAIPETASKSKLKMLSQLGADSIAELSAMSEKEELDMFIIDGVVVRRKENGLDEVTECHWQDVVKLFAKWLADPTMRPENDPEGVLIVEDQVRSFCIAFPKFGITVDQLLKEVGSLFKQFPELEEGLLSFLSFLQQQLLFNDIREKEAEKLTQFLQKTLKLGDGQLAKVMLNPSKTDMIPFSRGATSAGFHKSSTFRKVAGLQKRGLTKSKAGLRNVEDISIDTCSAVEIAEAFTQIDHATVTRIPTREFLMRMWERSKWEGTGVAAPAVFLAVKRWVKVCDWCASLVVREKKASKRGKVISWLIAMAAELYRLGNFQSLTAVISSLNGQSICRLKRSWENLKESDRRQFAVLDEVCQPMRHYHNYRISLEERIQSKSLCIPFTGVITQELTTLDDAEPDYKGKEAKINFEKCRFLGKIIGQLQSALTGKSDDPRLVEQAEENTRAHTIHKLTKFLPNTLQAEALYQRSIELEKPAWEQDGN